MTDKQENKRSMCAIGSMLCESRKMRRLKILLILLLPLTTFGQWGDIALNLNGLKKEVRDNGYNAKEVNYYDQQGNFVYTITYDRDGELEDTPMGVAIIKRKYGKSGHLIDQSYYDQNKKLLQIVLIGPAIKYKYDKNGNEIEKIYCNDKARPLEYGNGLTIITTKYDDKGNIIEKHHLNGQRQLIDGTCIFKYKYDQKGRKIEESRYDSSGQLIKTKGKRRPTILRYKYDQQDRITERTYYDENNELIDGEANFVYNHTKKPDTKSSTFSPTIISSFSQQHKRTTATTLNISCIIIDHCKVSKEIIDSLVSWTLVHKYKNEENKEEEVARYTYYAKRDSMYAHRMVGIAQIEAIQGKKNVLWIRPDLPNLDDNEWWERREIDLQDYHPEVINIEAKFSLPGIKIQLLNAPKDYVSYVKIKKNYRDKVDTYPIKGDTGYLLLKEWPKNHEIWLEDIHGVSIGRRWSLSGLLINCPEAVWHYRKGKQ